MELYAARLAVGLGGILFYFQVRFSESRRRSCDVGGLTIVLLVLLDVGEVLLKKLIDGGPSVRIRIVDRVFREIQQTVVEVGGGGRELLRLVEGVVCFGP